jgi:hypothetical protein
VLADTTRLHVRTQARCACVDDVSRRTPRTPTTAHFYPRREICQRIVMHTVQARSTLPLRLKYPHLSRIHDVNISIAQQHIPHILVSDSSRDAVLTVSEITVTVNRSCYAEISHRVSSSFIHTSPTTPITTSPRLIPIPTYTGSISCNICLRGDCCYTCNEQYTRIASTIIKYL